MTDEEQKAYDDRRIHYESAALMGIAGNPEMWTVEGKLHYDIGAHDALRIADAMMQATAKPDDKIAVTIANLRADVAQIQAGAGWALEKARHRTRERIRDKDAEIARLTAELADVDDDNSRLNTSRLEEVNRTLCQYRTEIAQLKQRVAKQANTKADLVDLLDTIRDKDAEIAQLRKDYDRQGLANNKALEALIALQNAQNGPPLLANEAEWDEAMTLTTAAIALLEAK